jgi:hypothetical protein
LPKDLDDLPYPMRPKVLTDNIPAEEIQDSLFPGAVYCGNDDK